VFGFDRDPTRRLAVLVGAHRLTEALADLLERHGRSTVVVDAAAWRLDRLRSRGLKVVCGDARDALSYQEAGVERDSMVVAATTNDELNLLVAQLVRDQFGVEHPAVALQSPPEELRKVSRAWIDLLGDRAADLPTWIRRLEGSTASVLELDLEHDEAAATLREAEREHGESIVRLLVSTGSEIGFDVSDERLETGSRLAVLVLNGKASELLDRFIVGPGEHDGATLSVPEAPESTEPQGETSQRST
jgi:Trk K+ transport system NAD-binding subunit